MKKINLKKILIFGLLVTALLIVPLHSSHANMITDGIVGSVSWILSTVAYSVGYIFAQAVYFAGLFLNWTLDLNSKILDNPIVKVGWEITRDLANLGFVFLIILISFGTILRISNFQIKTALPKLIAAVVLINFSLLGAAVFLDTAGVFTNFFINRAYTSTGDGGVALALTGMFGLQKFLSTPGLNPKGDSAAFTDDNLKYLANMIFADIMTALGALTLFSIALMFLIRYVAVGFLLITLPISILMWAAGSGAMKKWSDEFFKYTFFGPIAGFYIYLAIKSAGAFEGIVGASKVFNNSSVGSQLTGLAENIGSMIMVIAILLFGLKQAEEGCTYGGKAATNLVKGAMTGTGKFLGKAVLKTGGTLGAGIGAGLSVAGSELAQKAALSRYGIGTASEKGWFARSIRQLGVAAEKTKEGQGGKENLSSIMTEAMVGGKLGASMRANRIEDKNKLDKERLEIDNLAKKRVPFKAERGNEPDYIKEYEDDVKIEKAKILEEIKTETQKGKTAEGSPMERLTKTIDTNTTIDRLASKATTIQKSDFSDTDQGKKDYAAANKEEMGKLIKEIRGFHESVGKDMAVTKDTYGDRAKIANLVKQTGLVVKTMKSAAKPITMTEASMQANEKAKQVFTKWEKNTTKALEELLKEQKNK